MKSWNVAYVQSQTEFALARDLAFHGIEAYAPARKMVRKPRHIRREVEISVPLYARYVFFHPSSDHDFSYTIRHKDVIGVVRFGDQHAQVRDVVIRKLRALVDQGIFDEGIKPLLSDVLKKGDDVRVIEGLFFGMNGEFLKNVDDNALVAVSWKGKRITVRFPWAHIQAK